MQLTPDEIIFWEWGGLVLNATIVFSWVVMIVLVGASFLITRQLKPGFNPSKQQILLETIVKTIQEQIEEVSNQKKAPFFPFVATLFLYIVLANILSIVPGFRPPTGSLSTTLALAICVFFAVPVYGIMMRGPKAYFKQYLEPTPLMLPFNVIGEFSRTLSLAVRLFGNVMSGALIVGIILSLIPLFFPIVMQAFGLLTGVIQAYIFTILALVYISSGTVEEN